MNNEVLILVTEMSTVYDDEFLTIWGIQPKPGLHPPDVRYVSKDKIEKECVDGAQLVLLRGFGYDLSSEIVPEVITVCNTIKEKNPNVMITIGIHCGGTERTSELKEELNSQWTKRAEEVQIYDYHMHPVPEKFKSLIEYLKKLIEGERVNGFSEAIKDAIDWLSKNILIKLFLLKHHITHLWLPLDIDLQGIQEVRRGKSEVESKKPEERAKEYLEDVLNGKEQYYYRQKLADLQYMITGLEFGVRSSELNDPCSEVAKPVDCYPQTKEFMKDKESVLELIEKVKNAKEIEEIKQTLLTLSGLNTNSQPDPASPIFQFMCYLDCLIKSRENITPDTVNEVSQKEKEVFETQNSEQRATHNEPQNTNFHSWFCTLDKCLDKLGSLVE